MAEVRWTPQALDDLEAICLFIARDSPAMASIFAQRAFAATDRLADFALSGRSVPEFNNPSVREVVIGSYRLIYRIVSGDAQILTIHHGARLLDESAIKGSSS
jgi:toxin ParE1/3/4